MYLSEFEVDVYCLQAGQWARIIHVYPARVQFNFSSIRRSPMMRPQQDFSKSFCSCCCPPLLSCSFLLPLGLLSHYLSTSLVVFLCFLLPPLVRIALLPVVCFPPSLLRARTTSAFFFSDFVYQCDLLSQLLSGNLISYPVSSEPSQYSSQPAHFRHQYPPFIFFSEAPALGPVHHHRDDKCSV